MSTLLEALQYQIAHTRWANSRVLSAASQLSQADIEHDFHTSEKSIRGTLVHIYRAERVWLSRINPPAVEFRVDGDDEMDSLQRNWPTVSDKWVNWSLGMDSEMCQLEIAYRDLKGNNWTQPLWQIVLQVVNHSTHHRGQVIGFIRSLGYAPPNVDSITFAREQSALAR